MRSAELRRGLCALAVLASALAADREVQAHGDNNDATVIHACVNVRRGDVRIVAPGQDCQSNESRSHWAIVGPPGPQGPPGPSLSGIDALDGLACARDGFPGVIELTYDPTGIVVLTCVVSATEAALSASATLLQFNAVQTKTVTITNTGQLSSGPISVSLTASPHFQLTGDTCSGIGLAGGASCAVDVHFSDTLGLLRTGTLSVTANPGGNLQIQLLGQTL